MFKSSTFSDATQPKVEKGTNTTMNNAQQQSQDGFSSKVKRSKKAKKETTPMDIKALLSQINEAETQLIMMLALIETNPEFALNTMGSIQDVMTKIIESVKPHTEDVAVIINECNAISWELTKTVVIAFQSMLPKIKLDDQDCPHVSAKEIDAMLEMTLKQVASINCSMKHAEEIIKGVLMVLAKIKVMAPRIIRLMDKMTALSVTLETKFQSIEIDPYYAGNAFDQQN